MTLDEDVVSDGIWATIGDPITDSDWTTYLTEPLNCILVDRPAMSGGSSGDFW